MKKLITFICSICFYTASLGQAIMLNASDIPVPSAPFNIDDITSTLPPSPAIGDNQVWDYSVNFGNSPLTNVFNTETETFFLNAGIDVNRLILKSLNTTAGYNMFAEYDFNVYGVYEAGAFIDYQAYELSAFTGNNQDSIIFPSQQYLFSTPKTVMQFPITANSSWHSESPRTTDFNLTVAAYGLNNTPGRHAYTIFRSDSIVGWGKLSVYTPAGPSVQYDVLMAQISEYAVDSFYLNGSPAPAPLLNAFQVSQGQRSDEQYFYHFYRTGNFNYLMRIAYGLDSTYTSIVNAFVHTDNLTTSLDEIELNYSTLLFPNPSNGNILNIKITGQSFELTKFSVVDLTGKTVQQGIIDSGKNDFTRIEVSTHLTNGIYFIKVEDRSGREVVNEQINLQR